MSYRRRLLRSVLATWRANRRDWARRHYTLCHHPRAVHPTYN